MFDTAVMIKAVLVNIGPRLDLANWNVSKAPLFLLVPNDLSVSIPSNNIVVSNCITLKDTALRFFVSTLMRNHQRIIANRVHGPHSLSLTRQTRGLSVDWRLVGKSTTEHLFKAVRCESRLILGGRLEGALRVY